MEIKNFTRLFCPVILASFVFLFINPCTATTKDFGVGQIAIQFTVHPDPHHSYKETLEDVVEKMKLVSSEFNLIFAFGDVIQKGENPGTYNDLPHVHSAEAAGQVKNITQSSLELFIGIHPFEDKERLEREVKRELNRALQSEKWNLRTVKGFIVDFKDTNPNIVDINTTVGALYTSIPFKNANIGLRLNCSKILEESSALSNIVSKIPRVNVLLCVEYPNINLQGKQAFDHVATQFQTISDTLKTISTSLQFFGQTGYPARANNKTEIEEMKMFWQSAKEWAQKTNISVVMTEAFDNPWVNWNDTEEHKGNYGLWGVSKNTDSEKFNVFKEKFSIKTLTNVSPKIATDGTSNELVKGNVGSQSVDLSFKYALAIFGMILFRLIL